MAANWLELRKAIESDDKKLVDAWINNNPTPPETMYLMQNPNLDAKEEYSLWFLSYNYNQLNHAPITQYFTHHKLNAGYWFKKENYQEQSYGILDALIERNEFDYALALLDKNPFLIHNLILPKTISALIVFNNDRKTITGFANILNIIFFTKEEILNSIDHKLLKKFFLNYFKLFPSDKNCIFQYYQNINHSFDNSYQVNNVYFNTQRLQKLINMELISENMAMQLACQIKVEKYFFENLFKKHFPHLSNPYYQNNKKIDNNNNKNENLDILSFNTLESYLIKIKDKILNLFGKNENNFIHTCITNHNYEALEWLLGLGFNPNEKDQDNMAPIHKIIRKKKFIDNYFYQDYDKTEYTQIINLLGKYKADLLSSHSGINILFHILKAENLKAHEKCAVIYEVSQNSPWEDFKASLKNFMKYLKKYELKFYNENLEAIQQLEIIAERKKLTYLNQFLRPNAYKEALKRLL